MCVARAVVVETSSTGFPGTDNRSLADGKAQVVEAVVGSGHKVV